MKALPIALIALMWTLSAPAAQAATIFSDDFNTENGGNGALNYNSFAQWSTSGGTVDLIGNGFFDFYPGHGLYIDLDGTVSQAGLLTSAPIALAAGSYSLQFVLAGSGRGDTNTVHVALGAFYSETFTLASSDPFAVITRSIVVGVPASASLTFQNDGGDNIGAILDNVKLDSVDGPPRDRVPEPVSMTMIMLGIAGIGIVRRRAAC